MSRTASLPRPVPARPHGAPWCFDDASSYLGVSKRHLHRLADLGRVRVIALGRRKFIPATELERLAREGA